VWRWSTLVLTVLGTGCVPKPLTVHVQGTAETVGSHRPIVGATVLIEWPASLGGGQLQVKTDARGHFAVGRTLRQKQPVCAGLALTVQAPSFASAYARHDEDSCGEHNVLDFALEMLPQPR
jgi:hypothetical protein